ncbi:MAG: hypothetical protein JWR42_1909 [Marmoricola sp.]|nr:hypothetical protein [Marmoricola sp.]
MRIPARVTTYAVGTTLALTGTLAVSAAPSQAASHDPRGAQQGATWLAGQLRGGLLPGQYGPTDVGLSIDAAFSLTSVGGHAADVTAIADALQGASGKDYIEYAYPFDSDGNGTVEQYAGRAANATGKALAFLESLPTRRGTVDGIDLRQRMESLTTDSGATRGRIVDYSTKDGTPDGQDYANTLGQAFAARGLSEAGSGEAGAAISFLLQQQCSDGGFRQSFSAASAADQTCGVGSSDTDATALTVNQLASLPSVASGPTVSAALTRARARLAGTQNSDGSWGGGTGTSGANANSTGLAAAALATASSSDPRVERAARWLRDHQVTSYDLCDRLSSAVGALSYDQDALTAGRRSGIPDSATADQFRRATAQALPGLAYLPVDSTPSAPRVTTATGYVRAGSSQVLRITGVHAGDQLCVRGGLTKTQLTASATTASATAKMPSTTGNVTYTVVDADDHAGRATAKVLGAKKLGVAVSRYRVRRSHFVTATVSGLASGEKAAISYRGSRVRSGVASTSGTFKATFRVGRSLGRKAVVGVGQFTDIRRGTGFVRVVR